MQHNWHPWQMKHLKDVQLSYLAKEKFNLRAREMQSLILYLSLYGTNQDERY